MSKLFPTYEVGSMPKLNARVKALMKETKNNNSDKDIEDIISLRFLNFRHISLYFQ